MLSRQSGELTGAAASRWSAGGIRSADASLPSQEAKQERLSAAFFWLTAFYFAYCARPEDWIPPLGSVPIAKIAIALTTLSLLLSLGRTSRRLSDLPKEAFYLLLLVLLLFASSLLSPVWKGGAFFITLDFAKVCIVWILTFLLVTTLGRLRRIIFLQAASVAAISFVAIVKGHSVPRLAGVIEGTVYSNPNDMAFAIVLCIPFCLAFLLSARGLPRKAAWCFAIAVMTAALMLTASRAGFIDLVIAGAVLLWQFGVKGKRPYLIVGAVFLSVGLLLVAGKDLVVRFNGIVARGSSAEQDTAHESFEERKALMIKAIDAIAHYPILGVGAGDFVVYSGMWRDVHASYLQIAADGGIPVLILYLMFFGRGFANLRALGRKKNLDGETILFVGALKSSLIGFLVGAWFAPEAYQFFPYFTVCYTSVLLAMSKEQEGSKIPSAKSLSLLLRYAKAC